MLGRVLAARRLTEKIAAVLAWRVQKTHSTKNLLINPDEGLSIKKQWERRAQLRKPKLQCDEQVTTIMSHLLVFIYLFSVQKI